MKVARRAVAGRLEDRRKRIETTGAREAAEQALAWSHDLTRSTLRVSDLSSEKERLKTSHVGRVGHATALGRLSCGPVGGARAQDLQPRPKWAMAKIGDADVVA